jgi:hypothetical protein
VTTTEFSLTPEAMKALDWEDKTVCVMVEVLYHIQTARLYLDKNAQKTGQTKLNPRKRNEFAHG